MRRFFDYVGHIRRWLIKPARGWLVVGALAWAVAGIRTCPFALETKVRWAGMILQYFGLGVVMSGILGRGKLFQLPNPLRLLRSWFRELPRWKSEGKTIALTAHAKASAKASVDMTVIRATRPAAEVEERLAAAEAAMIEMRNQIEGVRVKHEEDHSRLAEKIDKQRKEASEEIGEVRERMQRALAADINLEWAGILLLAVGLFLGSTSPEVARWFAR